MPNINQKVSLGQQQRGVPPIEPSKITRDTSLAECINIKTINSAFLGKPQCITNNWEKGLKTEFLLSGFALRTTW